MKKRKTKRVYFPAALIAVLILGACDINNPVIDEWWVGPKPETPEPRFIVPIKTYTVTFEMEGGSYVDLRPTTDPNYVPPTGPIPAQIVLAGKATVYEPGLVENTTTPYFAGWYTAPSSGGIRWDFNTTPAAAAYDPDGDGTITLYARWSGSGIEVKFDLNIPTGSGITGVNTTYYNEAENHSGLPLPEYLTPGVKLSQPKGFGLNSTDMASKYAFTGWYTWNDSNVDGIVDNSELTLWDFDTMTPSGNTTLYAGWGTKASTGVVIPPESVTKPAVPVYKVTFNSKDAKTTPPEEQVVEGDKIPSPGAIFKDNNTFTGWYKDESYTQLQLWDFNTMTPTADMSLYAGWAENPPISYTVSFDMRGGTYVDLAEGEGHPWTKPPDQKVVPGSATVYEPGLVENPAHKFFSGWYKDESCTQLWDFDTSIPTADMTLYAGWNDTGYTVTFSPGGDFDRNGTINSATEIDWSHTVYEPRSEYVASNIQLSQPTGFGLKPDDPFASAYAFTGWYTDVNGNGIVDTGDTKWDFTQPVESNMTLYAGWGTKTAPGVTPAGVYQPEYGGTPIPIYTVSFDSDGANTIPPDEAVVSGNKLPAPDAIHKDDYVFTGWYMDKEYTKEWDFSENIVKESYDGSDDDNKFTLYAKWEPEPYTPPWYDANYSLINNKEIGKFYYPFQVIPGGYDFGDWDDTGGGSDNGATNKVNLDTMNLVIDQLKKHPDAIACIVGYEDSPGDNLDTKRELQTWWMLWQETGVDPKQLVINTALPPGYQDSDPDDLLNSEMIIGPNDSEGVVGPDGDEIKVYIYIP